MKLWTGYETLGMFEGKHDLVMVWAQFMVHNPVIHHSSQFSLRCMYTHTTGTGAPQCG